MSWIKTEDKLPIEEGQVIICWGEPFFGVATQRIGFGYYDIESKKFLFWLNDKEVLGHGVTHWKPLPKLPK